MGRRQKLGAVGDREEGRGGWSWDQGQRWS